MSEDAIPKLYYAISEVSELCGEETSTLRFWETKFPQLQPRKNRAGRRVYTDEDIAVVRRIQYLLRERKHTIEGAQELLDREETDAPPGGDLRDEMLALRGFLVDLLERLDTDADKK